MKDYQFETKKGFIYPSENFNDFWCFMSWELVTIVAESNSWKTTFAMDIISKNAERGRKGFYINLEFPIETMRQSRRLRFHWKGKDALTDLNKLSDYEKNDMQTYVNTMLKKFDYYNNAQWISLDALETLLNEKAMMGYELFVIDTFSRIGNNMSNDARESQNKCMAVLQELAQKLDIAIVVLHHTNRHWTWEWTQKIMDLSNVFIIIEKDSNCDGVPYRRYKLMKDKFTPDKEIELYYKGWEYLKDDTELSHSSYTPAF